MNWKEFFKPTTKKIVIFLILIIGLNYLIISSPSGRKLVVLGGLPFGFYPVMPSVATEMNFEPDLPVYEQPDVNFSFLYLFLNIIFWYFFVCIFSIWFKSSNKWSFNSFFSVFLLLLILSSFVIMVLWFKNPRFNLDKLMVLILPLVLIIFSIYQLNKKGFKDSYEIE